MIERFSWMPMFGTFGRLFVYSDEDISRASVLFRCFTLELPWIENMKEKSCIPVGCYIIEKGNFRNKYDNYELRNVIGRTDVEMHRVNIVEELEGCVGLGTNLYWFNKLYDREVNTLGLSGSKTAFDGFMKAMDGDERALLYIKNQEPQGIL
jgi:hypothetical protein